jgi:hypothetical protein
MRAVAAVVAVTPDKAAVAVGRDAAAHKRRKTIALAGSTRHNKLTLRNR